VVLRTVLETGLFETGAVRVRWSSPTDHGGIANPALEMAAYPGGGLSQWPMIRNETPSLLTMPTVPQSLGRIALLIAALKDRRGARNVAPDGSRLIRSHFHGVGSQIDAYREKMPHSSVQSGFGRSGVGNGDAQP